MAFGDNILSQDAVDWSVVQGSYEAGQLTLHAGGSATQHLDITDLVAIPEAFYVSIIASSYTNAYSPNAYIVIRVETALNYFEYSAPIVDNGNGYCIVQIPVTETDFTSLSFTIRSDYYINVSSIVLATPILDAVDVDSILEEIPKILDDYNTNIFEVGQEETTIGFITMNLLQNTDMNGHFLLTYISPGFAVLTIRIKDNEITELYTPIIYNLVPGRNSIGIPHAYVRKLAGIHTMAVTAQVSTGTISIITRGMLFTIDGGHMAKRLIDIDVNVTDLTMRQLITELEPSLVYAVGIEDSMARVRYRSFRGDASLVWEPIYEVGPAVDAAIEFNGVWAERSNDLGYTIITELMPWVFWINESGTLYGQYGTNEDTLVELASGVSTVSAVRGFKSYSVPENDQGLVVVYIKSGLVYYRPYATQDTEETVWEAERQITEAGTGVTSAFITRLNDYRLALSITGSSGNKLFHTERTFAGQAFKSDMAYVVDTIIPTPLLPDITRFYPMHSEHVTMFDCSISFQYGESAESFFLPTLTYFETSDNKDFILAFDCDFFGIDTIDVANISVAPSNTIVSIEYVDEHVLHVVFASEVDTEGSITLTFANTQYAGYTCGGPTWFTNVVWPISFVTPEPAMHPEEALVVDAAISGLQYADINYEEPMHPETVLVVDSSVTLTEFFAISSEPI